ncbi:hypothetical protein HaLaN_12843, partial [Haematococcus lacustris]
VTTRCQVEEPNRQIVARPGCVALSRATVARRRVAELLLGWVVVVAAIACIATVVGEGLPLVPGPTSGSMPDEPPPRGNAVEEQPHQQPVRRTVWTAWAKEKTGSECSRCKSCK